MRVDNSTALINLPARSLLQRTGLKNPALGGANFLQSPSLTVIPIIDVGANVILGFAIPLLNSAFQLFSISVDLRQIVVRQLTQDSRQGAS